MGPNGAGKTSLLRACAGLLPVTSGEAVVLGVDLTHGSHGSAPLRRPLGSCRAPLRRPQRGGERPVRRPRPRPRGCPSADDALERVGLTGRLRTTPAGRLSAGQRRRVALAALLARRPALWLLDEPHAGLDAASRTLLGQLIGERWPDGATVLLSSHEPQLSVPLADRVVSMGGGRVTGEKSGGRRATLTAVPSTTPARQQGRGRGGHACGMTPSWSRARTCASRRARGSACGRSFPSPSSSWCSSRSPSARTSRRCGTRRRGSSGWRCSSRPCWPSSAASPWSRARGRATGSASRASTRPASSWARRPRSASSCWRSSSCSGLGVTFLFDVRVHVVWLAVVASLLATVGLACAGVLYGALSAGLRVRDTLLPAPGAAGAGAGAAGRLQGRGRPRSAASASSGTQWLKILVPFAVIYLVVGIVLYGPLQEAA